MGLTRAQLVRGKLNNMRAHLVKLTFDASYPTGGEPLTPALLDLKKVHHVFVEAAPGGYAVEYDPTNKKLKARVCAAEANHNHTLSASTLTTTLTRTTQRTRIPLLGLQATNTTLITNFAAADNTTPFTIASQPGVARNLTVSVKNNSGGPLSGNAANYAIIGTLADGEAGNETISFSAGDLASMAGAAVVTKAGVKAFALVTSITPSAAQPANFQRSAGIADLIGVGIALPTPAEADIIKVTKNGVHLAHAGLYNATNNTLNLATITANDNVVILARAKATVDTAGTTLDALTLAAAGSAAAGPAAEVADTTNLATLSVWVFALGW